MRDQEIIRIAPKGADRTAMPVDILTASVVINRPR
jgi:hypothetical protein